jgi:molybdopterin molybdotransferase
MIQFDEAQARMLALAVPLPVETVALGQAAGRWAAADIVARRTQPGADLSAMDGYAIRFAELPGPWRIVGEAAAGGSLGRALAPGEAARIFTGAPLPDGADTILIQEEAARDGDLVSLAGEGPPRPGAHVRPRGNDFAEGATLIRAGEALTPARIALAAMGGHGALPVRRRARIAILSTGDELVPPGSPPDDARLPASNAPMLAALLGALPVEVADHGIVRDNLDSLIAAIEAMRGADIIVTSGGASVGDHDLVRPAFERAGAAINFWKIAMRPGKPLMAGRLGEAMIVGLPGNPVSAFFTALLFVRPLAAALMGAADPLPRTRCAILGAALPAVGARTDFVRGAWADGRVVPAGSEDSARLSALAGSAVLMMRPAGSPPAAPGDRVDILDLA